MEYTLMQKVKVVYGLGAVSEINNIIKDGKYRKPLLVYDKGMEESGIIYKVKDCLIDGGISFSEFEQVVPDPPARIIDKAGEVYRAEGCDCIVAVGGGSAIDTAKGLNIVGNLGGSILDYADKSFDVCRGLISVPTTSGTGSELSQGIIVTDEKRGAKIPILAYNSMSEYAVIDPELTMALPPSLTAFTGLDVFSHSAEAYTTVNANGLTDIICEKLMETVKEYLPKAAGASTDLKARERMSCAAALGGWMLYNSSAHMGHGLAHVIGNTYHVPHGLACAYTLPVMLEFISETSAEKVKKIGEILGAEFDKSYTFEEISAREARTIGKISARAYLQFRDSLEGMTPIKVYGVTKDRIRKDMDMLTDKLGEEVFNELCPRKIDADEREEILRSFMEYL